MRARFLALFCVSVSCADEATEQTCEDMGEACTELLVSRCVNDAQQVCVTVNDCNIWSEPVLCSPGVCVEGACHGCAGEAGSYREQSIEVDGEDRFYFLHVPQGYVCEQAWPVLIDFHGTAGYPAEEAYALDELVELANAESFILVRPRSRFSEDPIWGRTYRWDQNIGDIDKNIRFVRGLIFELSTRYHFDVDRIYASGFSSGTNMASQFLDDPQITIAGYGLVGGGYWSNRGQLPDYSLATAPRIYAVTGFRDYMYTYLRFLLDDLAAHAFPDEQIFNREVDTGHDLYGWHYAEMWDWLEHAERPALGTLSLDWQLDVSFVSGESALAIASSVSGDLVVVGTNGSLWYGDGTWTTLAQLEGSFAPNWTGICLTQIGRGLAVGEGMLATSDDGGQSWVLAGSIPEFGDPLFGFSYLNDISCRGTTVMAGGYWAGVGSTDGGNLWQQVGVIADYGSAAQVAAVELAPSGTAVAVGYFNYVGRSIAHGDFLAQSLPLFVGWYNGVATFDGQWWVVGEQGTILYSPDDGLTWQTQSAPTNHDLFAVAFQDALVGMAVGLHGTALLTVDGGVTWQDVSTGVDLLLGDLILRDGTATVVGEAGTVLSYTLP